MARSTYNAPVTTYSFSATGSAFSLPPVQLKVDRHPFSLTEWFDLNEAKALRDELDAVITAVEAEKASAAEAAEVAA